MCEVVFLSDERSLSWGMAVTCNNPSNTLFIPGDAAHQGQCSLGKVSYYLARIQYALWIKQGLDLAHPFEGRAVFGLHIFHFHQAYSMFACGCATKFQRALDKLFGESLGSPILLGWRGN